MTGYRSSFFRHDCKGEKGCYIQGLPSWDDIIAVLPRGIRPTDIDGMVEINDHFLFIEEKSAGKPIDAGQAVALKRLSRRERVTILCLRPAPCSEVEVLVLRDGAGTGWQPRSRQQLLDWISEWARDADTKQLGT